MRNFAEDRGIPASSFYQWIRARGGSRQGKKKSAKTPRRPQPLVEVETRPSADFAEVTVVDTARPRSEITVMTAAGHTITIEGEAIDPSILELVLGAVKAC
ncbi:MAG: hypothetical protein GY871_07380 [Actinomycetales bacterium]|nr:hypothetical protein [Actinomycetales bacterium]